MSRNTYRLVVNDGWNALFTTLVTGTQETCRDYLESIGRFANNYPSGRAKVVHNISPDAMAISHGGGDGHGPGAEFYRVVRG